jgi:hypothetical protein
VFRIDVRSALTRFEFAVTRPEPLGRNALDCRRAEHREVDLPWVATEPAVATAFQIHVVGLW